MSEKTRMVYDETLTKGMPASSKFISSNEWEKLYPDGIRRSKDFIFNAGMPQPIPEKEAFFLVKKYPELKIKAEGQTTTAPIIDELEEMPTKEMRILAEKYYINIFQKRNVDLIAEIRQRREEGVIPMKEDVYKDHKYNATMKVAREEWENSRKE